MKNVIDSLTSQLVSKVLLAKSFNLEENDRSPGSGGSFLLVDEF
jgi:hypothetical protein